MSFDAECSENAFHERADGLVYCGYCGSFHPVVLARLLKEGKVTLSGCDWKYGWPHKFYVNPTDDTKYSSIKFYANHLQFLDEKTFNEVASIISAACNIRWERKEGALYYCAPYDGYQKSR